jgi:hypothetical protein
MPQPPAARIAAHKGRNPPPDRYLTKAILRTISKNLEDLIAASLRAGLYFSFLAKPALPS